MQVKHKTPPIKRTPFIPIAIHSSKNNASQKIWVALVQELYEVGVTQQMIMQHCKISLQTLNRLENDEVQAPTYPTFKKILIFYCNTMMGLSKAVS